MLCADAAAPISELVVHLADPDTTATALQPGISVPSDSNSTVPPLNVPAGELTVAVNVTLWPNEDGFVLLVTDVVVDARLTVWLYAGLLVDAKKLALPENDAVIE